MRKFFVVLPIFAFLTLPAMAQEARYNAAKPKSRTHVDLYTNADLPRGNGTKLPKAKPDGVITVKNADGTVSTGYIYVAQKRK